MDWTDYLSSVVRLVDLHDSGHKPGTASLPPNEDRPGLKNGLWLNVGVKLIEYLHENDIEANEGWIYLGEFIQEMEIQHGISEDDVQYIVTYLATPSRIYSINSQENNSFQSIKITKETALVERPRHQVADRCRLTRTGRQALQIAKMASSWLYTKHDASKLRTAILTNDFGTIIHLATVIAQAVRSFSHEITRLLERPGEQEVWETYTKRADDYIEAINGVGSAVIDASQLLASKEIRLQFNEWQLAQKTDVVSADSINEILMEIMQSITKLRRKFADLITELASQKRNIIGNVNFDKAAIHTVFKMPSHEQIELCLFALGPWETDIHMPSPNDLYGVMASDIEEEQTDTIEFDNESLESLPAPIHKFLERYRKEIIESLRKGPVSISDAIKKGWIKLDEKIALTELVGVYSSPDWLGDESKNIGIGFTESKLNSPLPDGSYLYGNNLIMFLKKTES